jgi:hypothetical protein
LYYYLKDNTPKKLLCQGCWEISDTNDVFEGKCKERLDCSFECAERVGRIIREDVSLTLENTPWYVAKEDEVHVMKAIQMQKYVKAEETVYS